MKSYDFREQKINIQLIKKKKTTPRKKNQRKYKERIIVKMKAKIKEVENKQYQKNGLT